MAAGGAQAQQPVAAVFHADAFLRRKTQFLRRFAVNIGGRLSVDDLHAADSLIEGVSEQGNVPPVMLHDVPVGAGSQRRAKPALTQPLKALFQSGL